MRNLFRAFEIDEPVTANAEKFVGILHPSGGNLRALRLFLQRRDYRLALMESAEDVRRLPEGSAVVVHADLLDSSLAEHLSFSFRPPLIQPLIIVVPKQVAADPRLIPPHAVQLGEPYYFESLLAAIESRPKTLPDNHAEYDHRHLNDLMARVMQSIGHGLSTPLVAAQGWLDMVLSDIDESDPLRRNLRHVTDELSRAADLAGLLSHSRQTGDIKTKSVRLVDAVLKACRVFDSSPIQCIIDMDDDLPDIQADPEHLSRALEILTGAIHRSAGTVDRLRISTDFDADNVRLSITEIGRGFRGSQMSSLCKVGRALLDHAPSRGLAYPIVYEIMARMNVPVRMAMTSDTESLLTFEFAVMKHRRSDSRQERQAEGGAES